MKKNKIFKENLTSKLLQKQALKILKKQSKKNVCEVGCGDGNISNYLISNLKKKHYFYLSDISRNAINAAKKKLVIIIQFLKLVVYYHLGKIKSLM